MDNNIVMCEMVKSALVARGHELVGQVAVIGADSAVPLYTAKSRDKWGVWTWHLTANTRHGHLRWEIVRAEVGYRFTTRLDAELPDWSKLDELLAEGVALLVKQRKASEEYRAARKMGGVDEQLRPVRALPPDATAVDDVPKPGAAQVKLF